jgi:hypothetical protein
VPGTNNATSAKETGACRVDDEHAEAPMTPISTPPIGGPSSIVVRIAPEQRVRLADDLLVLPEQLR